MGALEVRAELTLILCVRQASQAAGMRVRLDRRPDNIGPAGGLDVVEDEDEEGLSGAGKMCRGWWCRSSAVAFSAIVDHAGIFQWENIGIAGTASSTLADLSYKFIYARMHSIRKGSGGGGKLV